MAVQNNSSTPQNRLAFRSEAEEGAAQTQPWFGPGWAKPTAVGWFRKQAPPPSRGQAQASASLLSHPHFEAALSKESTLLVSH